MIDKARELALKTLYKRDKEQAYSNIALNDEIKQNRTKLNEKDIGLISELVYGVTTWKLTIDEIIKKYSKIKLKKISPWIINILRMGTYQIIFLHKIPKSAAVNESVNLAKRYGHSSSSNFVNAILRKVEKNDYEELYKIENDVERISKTTSMPEWIVEELIGNYGKCKAEEICKNSNLKSKIAIRINTLKTTENELIKVLGLEERRTHLPNELSGGQQQRTSIGRAMITNPAIILADEPTGNLDSKASDEIVTLLKKSNKDYKQTIIMITHNLEIAKVADRIIKIEDGKIVEEV